MSQTVAKVPPPPSVSRLVEPPVFVKRQCCVVRGFTFQFIHQLEGKWSGEINRLQGNGKSLANKDQPFVCQTRSISTKIEYDLQEEAWRMRETTAGVDGAASVVHFKLTPVSDGILSIEVCREAEDGGEG
eukprot:GHVN01000278.1.p1 GENE.GHVN01000278.1~~GHVN01000278.1.p1  ORF type:complete len:145 (+),score=16.34 GHVN01000278.1:46-435(+)